MMDMKRACRKLIEIYISWIAVLLRALTHNLSISTNTIIIATEIIFHFHGLSEMTESEKDHFGQY